MTDPDTLVKGARDEGEAAMTALECRPTVCHCPNGTREVRDK